VDKDRKREIILIIRISTGLVWFGTVIRRILVSNFEERLLEMSQGQTLLPPNIMSFAVDNVGLLFILIISLEIISSLSLITGTFSRLGAILATILGFGIGLAGMGISLVDLLIPWTVAICTLYLAIFTHSGAYKGVDSFLEKKNLPRILKILI
jgi:uncharacterized membrane protein YphA (DoxX/SURF4 family)